MTQKNDTKNSKTAKTSNFLRFIVIFVNFLIDGLECLRGPTRQKIIVQKLFMTR